MLWCRKLRQYLCNVSLKFMRKPKTIQQLIKEMDQRYLEMYHERNNPKNPNEDWPERKEQKR